MRIARIILSFAVVVSLLIGAIACSNIKEIKVGDIHEVDLKGLHDNILTLKVLVPIENPNPFTLKIKEADLKVMIGNKEIGKVKQIDDLVIMRKSTNEYPVTIKVELTNVNEIMASAMMMFSGGIHDARLTGTVVVKSFLYRKKIKIEDFPLVR